MLGIFSSCSSSLSPTNTSSPSLISFTHNTRFYPGIHKSHQTVTLREISWIKERVHTRLLEFAIPLDDKQWTDGYFADIGKIIGGVWLGWWIQAAAATSNIGMFLAEMSSDSFQLFGMAERGMLPEVFAKRSRYGTPWVGVLFSAFGVVLLSWLSFQEIVEAENLLYCFGMVLEFIAFVKLRVKFPAASRPFKIPFGVLGSILMCIPPTILIGFIAAFSNLKVAAVVIGLVLKPCLKLVEKKRWLKFSVSSHLPDLLA